MKLLTVLLVLLTGCGCVSPEFGQLQATTLRLEYVDGGVCSGTAVGRHTVLTATHCQDGAELWTVNGQVVQVTAREDDGKDHTLLWVSIEFKSFTPIGGELQQGDQVEYWGNPGGLANQYRRGVVSGAARGATLIDASGWKGDSGAGIFKDGRVASLITGIYERGSFGLMVAFPLAFTTEQISKIN